GQGEGKRRERPSRVSDHSPNCRTGRVLRRSRRFPKMTMRRTVPYLRTAAWLFLALLFLYPMLWMALSSFKSSNVEIFGHPFSLPHQISLANYQKAVRQGHMGAYFINSLWVTGLSAAAVVCFGAWAGFALSKARFPFRKFWLVLFFIGMILPVQSYLIPLTGLLETLGVHD